MVKKIFLIWLCFIPHVFGWENSGILFIESDWTEVLTAAKAQNRLIFVNFHIADCEPCALMERHVFSDEATGRKFNATFINFKVNARDKEGLLLAKRYAVESFPSGLFLNADGELLHRVQGAMPARQFNAEADKAVAVIGNLKTLSYLENEHQSGNRSPAFLLEFMQKQKLYGKPTDTLLQQYLEGIPEATFKTEKVLSIISEYISSVDSKAFELLVNALPRFINLTQAQQRFVLDGISAAKRGTFQMAVMQKDKDMLERLIAAVRKTAYSDAGFEAEERQFRLDFARSTNDVDNFRMVATKDAARLMEKNTEQLATESRQRKERFVQHAAARGINEQMPQYKQTLEEMEDSAEKLAAFRLNEYALGYLQLIQSRDELETALSWAERSTALFESPINLDTRARLLARLGRKKEAIKIEKAAIKLAEKHGSPTTGLKQHLKEIQAK